MNEIASYIPQFLVRGHARIDACQCAYCRDGTPCVARAWTNHVRHSAVMQCDSVAHEALFARDAFELHERMSEAGKAGALSVWRSSVNQACIYLLIAPGLTIRDRMHTIGVLLSRLARPDVNDDDVALPIEVAAELIDVAAQDVLHAQFRRVQVSDLYRRAYLRRLVKASIHLDVGAQAERTLNLKRAELQVLSDGFLSDALRSLEQSSEVDAFFGKHDHVWPNYFLYRCYDEVFPAVERGAYPQAFLDVCLDYFCLRNYCALLAASDIALDERVVSQLFAAWHRGGKASLARDDHADPLVVGFSLIGGEGD